VLRDGCREPDGEEEEATPWKEQENWESHQIAAASMRTGAKDRKAKAQQYDLVFDDAIGFVQDQMLAGAAKVSRQIAHRPGRHSHARAVLIRRFRLSWPTLL